LFSRKSEDKNGAVRMHSFVRTPFSFHDWKSIAAVKAVSVRVVAPLLLREALQFCSFLLPFSRELCTK